MIQGFWIVTLVVGILISYFLEDHTPFICKGQGVLGDS